MIWNRYKLHNNLPEKGKRTFRNFYVPRYSFIITNLTFLQQIKKRLDAKSLTRKLFSVCHADKHRHFLVPKSRLSSTTLLCEGTCCSLLEAGSVRSQGSEFSSG